MDGALYKIETISDKKNLGCVALKPLKIGTVISLEKPLIPTMALSSESGQPQLDINRLINSYESLDSTDQEAYLSLDDGLDGSANQKERICGVYHTNAFDMGLGLQSSRFNHSCSANANMCWNEDEGKLEIVAVTDINQGEEITINYAVEVISMKNLQFRRKYISETRNFDCQCDLCLQESQNCDNSEYDTFDKLQENATEIRQSITNNPKSFTFDKVKQEIECYKQMFEIAMKMKANKEFIFNQILEHGCKAAAQGYFAARKLKNNKLIEEFKRECEFLCNAAKFDHQ